MLRFDSEADLGTHDLGRLLLLMLCSDGHGQELRPQRMHFDRPQNPFEAIRTRLAAIDVAFQGLQAQVLLAVGVICQTFRRRGAHKAIRCGIVIVFGALEEINLEMAFSVPSVFCAWSHCGRRLVVIYR